MMYREFLPYLIFLTIGTPWIGAFIVWVTSDNRPRALNFLASAFSLIAAIAALLLLDQSQWTATNEVSFQLPMGPFIGDMTFVADGLGVYLAVIATVIGSLTVIFSIGYMAGSAQLSRYYALVLLFIGSMCGLVLSGNLLFLFLFWEATAFCSYALISFHNDDPKAVAAGIKALIITQLGGVGLLIGIVIAAANLPDLQVSTFLAQSGSLPSNILAVIAFSFLFAAIAKSAQVPLHVWLPDAMEAPTPVSALIHAATMVNAGVYLLARFYPSFVPVTGWTTIVITVGILSALLAAGMAIMSNDLKRVLAYSTVSQLGYMVTGVGIGAIFQSQFYLFSHSIFKALLFLGAGAIIHELGTRDMREMGNLWKRMPQVAIPFLIGAAALVGLPFFNGYWSKELLIEAAFEYNLVVFVLLVIGAGITAFYASRMCWMVFFAKPQAAFESFAPVSSPHRPHVHWSMLLAIFILAINVLFAWLTAGRFALWLRAVLPYHAPYILHGHDPATLISWATIFSISALATLSVTILAIGAWWWRVRSDRPADVSGRMSLAIRWLDFAFNRSVSGIASVTMSAAGLLQKTQTGQLNWNTVGIAMALIALLIILVGIR
jgi:NADH-quinone oxidoreductase subunit L